MKVFDSLLTDRGTIRKKTYFVIDDSLSNRINAKKQAFKDMRIEKKNSKIIIETIKPYKHKNSIEYWLNFERKFLNSLTQKFNK